MGCVLLVDLGSTFTKVVAVDLEAEKVLATAKAPTTAQTNLKEGLMVALAKLEGEIGPQNYAASFAASSAAGGLKMVAVGLVPQLTAKAAELAALGAGAKVLATYAYELAPEELSEIETLAPEIILLCGGTDGGNEEVLLANARHLAGLGGNYTVIVAGNKVVAHKAGKILEQGGCEVVVTANVMPEFNKLRIEPSQKAIRELFLAKIVKAKGLEQVAAFLGTAPIPTPRAVLQGAELLAKGTAHQEGLGELLVVDVGGATVDVYSQAQGAPKGGAVLRGLPEPFSKRTVEGDLGLGPSLGSTAATMGEERLGFDTGLDSGELRRYLEKLKEEPGSADPKLQALEQALARFAIGLAVERHAGRIEEYYTPTGFCYVQTGKDLTKIPTFVGTGGPLIHSPDPKTLLSGALGSKGPVLMPQGPKLYLDQSYLLASMGLLSQRYPEVALKVMKEQLVWIR